MSKEHLIPFKPGHKKTGGKKKGYEHPATIIKRFLAMNFDTPEELKALMPDAKYTIGEIMVMAQAMKALKGSEKSFEMLTDRIAGKPTQPIAGDDDGAPINVNVHM